MLEKVWQHLLQTTHVNRLGYLVQKRQTLNDDGNEMLGIFLRIFNIQIFFDFLLKRSWAWNFSCRNKIIGQNHGLLYNINTYLISKKDYECRWKEFRQQKRLHCFYCQMLLIEVSRLKTGLVASFSSRLPKWL